VAAPYTVTFAAEAAAEVTSIVAWWQKNGHWHWHWHGHGHRHWHWHRQPAAHGGAGGHDTQGSSSQSACAPRPPTPGCVNEAAPGPGYFTVVKLVVAVPTRVPSVPSTNTVWLPIGRFLVR
jgi:hypothetical protein